MNSEDFDNKYLLMLKRLVGEVSSPDVNHKLTYKWDSKNRIIYIRFKSPDWDPREYIGIDNLAKLMHLQAVFQDLSFWLGVPSRSLWWRSVFTPKHERAHENVLTKDMHFEVSDSILGYFSDAENFELAGNYEKAAQFYENLRMFKKAGELRRMGKTQYEIRFQIGKDGVVKIQCPHCSASQPTESKSSEVTCKYCGKTYTIPKKILDMI